MSLINAGVIDVKPTDSELKMMIMVLANQQNKSVIDWKLLGPAMGYKSGTVAATRWSQIGKKLGFRSEAGASPNKKPATIDVPAPVSPTPMKRKRANAAGSAATKKSRMMKAMKVEKEEGTTLLTDEVETKFEDKKQMYDCKSHEIDDDKEEKEDNERFSIVKEEVSGEEDA